MPHLIRNIFMTMFKEILDKFVWVMINLAVVKPAPKIEEKRYQRLRNKPL